MVGVRSSEGILIFLKSLSDPQEAVERLGCGLEEVMGLMRVNQLKVLLVGWDLALGSRQALILEGAVLLLKDYVCTLEPGLLLDK